MKISKIGLLLLNILILNITISGANTMNTADLKPFYTVNIEARNIAFELLVNDIPVLSKDNDVSSNISKFPINPWLISGRNSFKIRIIPNELTKVDPSVAQFCKVIISGPKEILAQAEVKPPLLSKDGEFVVTLVYPTPPWTQSEKIGKDATTQKKILDKYREYHRFFEKKDLNGIMKFSAAQSNEYAKSMFNSHFESEKKNSFKEHFASGNALTGIDVQEKDGLQYKYYYGDRLVTVANVDDRSIIMYYDSDEGVTVEYPLFFFFDGQDFVLIL